jgi:hypothetical protein
MGAFQQMAISNTSSVPSGRGVSPPKPRSRTPAAPDYWRELGGALGLSAVDLSRLRSGKSLARAGVVFHIVADDDEDAGRSADAALTARLNVSLPLMVDAIAGDRLLRLLQTNPLTAQTLGLVIAAGPLGELTLVSTLSTPHAHEMALWIDAAAWLAQNILGAASQQAAGADDHSTRPAP